ncbi:hypothetical protein, conserved in T. vivax [Trypanosoma vivax Y486]|uniref:Uncharacterized protein n=1 Tax=Trypanosoma vivax (strain Y486) TaxID=1055687 RepID=F9WT14_TRYVY|nr:hypothetical protein, conserved in T. vivax [Trypanosoma vivax Y486]|eukprot:CCD20703.1 hypothetical protein, conserved in T. vivax [Trypanosoma vivax Y486]
MQSERGQGEAVRGGTRVTGNGCRQGWRTRQRHTHARGDLLSAEDVGPASAPGTQSTGDFHRAYWERQEALGDERQWETATPAARAQQEGTAQGEQMSHANKGIDRCMLCLAQVTDSDRMSARRHAGPGPRGWWVLGVVWCALGRRGGNSRGDGQCKRRYVFGSAHGRGRVGEQRGKLGETNATSTARKRRHRHQEEEGSNGRVGLEGGLCASELEGSTGTGQTGHGTASGTLARMPCREEEDTRELD